MFHRRSWLMCAPLLVSGCMHWSGGVSPASTPLARGGYTVLGPTVGTSCMYYFLSIVPMSRTPLTTTALKRAVGAISGAEALVEVTVDTSWESFLVVARNCVFVRGTAVKIAAGSSARAAPSTTLFDRPVNNARCSGTPCASATSGGTMAGGRRHHRRVLD